MKNVRLIVALCAALMIAAPAVALEVDVSGHYFVQTYNNSNENLSKTDATNDFGTMELMVKPVFKINDNITLTTQFTALQDHVWGEPTTPTTSTFTWPLPAGTEEIDTTNNFDWKAAYMTIKSPIGGFIVGRYIDTPWGLGLGDSTGSHDTAGSNSLHKDRIMWVIPVGDFISGAVYQRNEENDKGTAVSDQDFTKAYVFSAYKQENWSAGLLFANYTHKNYLSSKNLAYAATTAAYTSLGTVPYAVPVAPGITTEIFTGDTLGTGSWLGDSNAYFNTRGELTLWVLDPYFKGQFGPLGIEAEMLYGWGDVDQNGMGTDDLDAEGLGYFVDLSWDFGPVKVWGGTTYVQGDSDYLDDTASPMGYFERSIDHERGFLLTSDTSKLQNSLGGQVGGTALWNGTGFNMGNESGGPGTVTGTAGYQAFYVGIDWRITENLKLGGFFTDMTADDPPSTNPLGLIDQATFIGSGGTVIQALPDIQWDDEVGQEYDITLTWNIMPNLTFKGVFAYLDAGDFWKQGDPTKEIENNTTLYGQLKVDF